MTVRMFLQKNPGSSYLVSREDGQRLKSGLMLSIPALFGSLLLTWLAGTLLAAKLVLGLALGG